MIITAIQNTIIKTQQLSSSLLSDNQKINLPQGETINCGSISEGGHNHWVFDPSDSRFPQKRYFAYKPHCKIDWGNLITYRHFEASLPYARQSDIDMYFLPLNRALQEYEINTVIRIAAFLAQLAHESGSLRYKEELASGAAYEGRRDLGNIYEGDGRRYKGRGLIQLTGRANYTWASQKLGIDLVKNPLLAIKPETSARIAGLYWQSRNLNKYADWNSDRGFKIITRRINGGYNGLRDRFKHWKNAKKALLIG